MITTTSNTSAVLKRIAVRDKLLSAITLMDDYELVYIHNNYCDKKNFCDDYIYDMDEFDVITAGLERWEIARAAYYGGFEPINDFFYFNHYGNLASYTYRFEKKCPICVDYIVDYIIDKRDSLDNDSIQNILDEWEEEEEDENE